MARNKNGTFKKKSAKAPPTKNRGASPPKSDKGGSVSKKKKKHRTGCSGCASSRVSMLELVAPAAVQMFGPKLLISAQKISDASGAEKDKTALLLAAGGYYLTRTKYRQYAPAVFVAAAMAHRRRLGLMGKLPEDPKSTEIIISEATPSPK